MAEIKITESDRSNPSPSATPVGDDCGNVVHYILELLLHKIYSLQDLKLGTCKLVKELSSEQHHSIVTGNSSCCGDVSNGLPTDSCSVASRTIESSHNKSETRESTESTRSVRFASPVAEYQEYCSSCSSDGSESTQDIDDDFYDSLTDSQVSMYAPLFQKNLPIAQLKRSIGWHSLNKTTFSLDKDDIFPEQSSYCGVENEIMNEPENKTSVVSNSKASWEDCHDSLGIDTSKNNKTMEEQEFAISNVTGLDVEIKEITDETVIKTNPIIPDIIIELPSPEGKLNRHVISSDQQGLKADLGTDGDCNVSFKETSTDRDFVESLSTEINECLVNETLKSESLKPSPLLIPTIVIEPPSPGSVDSQSLSLDFKTNEKETENLITSEENCAEFLRNCKTKQQGGICVFDNNIDSVICTPKLNKPATDRQSSVKFVIKDTITNGHLQNPLSKREINDRQISKEISVSRSGVENSVLKEPEIVRYPNNNILSSIASLKITPNDMDCSTYDTGTVVLDDPFVENFEKISSQENPTGCISRSISSMSGHEEFGKQIITYSQESSLKHFIRASQLLDSQLSQESVGVHADCVSCEKSCHCVAHSPEVAQHSIKDDDEISHCDIIDVTHMQEITETTDDLYENELPFLPESNTSQRLKRKIESAISEVCKKTKPTNDQLVPGNKEERRPHSSQESPLFHENHLNTKSHANSESNCSLFNENETGDHMVPSTGSSFKWRYDSHPLCSQASLCVSSSEIDGDTRPLQYLAPPPCKRARRVGLSRRQKITPLHATFKRPEA